MATPEQITALAKLREPFPPHQISKLPKPTKAQTEAVRADYKKGIRCKECGTWHHPDVVHLDYVGHAALTDRLLDTDPEWSWEPLHVVDGLPVFDGFGGMWIKLTVCGVTRMGYGAAEGKDGPNAIKEVIGDALRNAAMRFGAALDLWHKGDLHGEGEDDKPETKRKTEGKDEGKGDQSPKAIAARITNGVATGEAVAAATYLSGLNQKALDAIWSLLDDATQDKLTAAWPEAA